jgi:prevent-host-death family protein
MKTTVKDLRLHLKKLLDRVSRGEDVVITCHGKPCAKIVPYQPNEAKISDNKFFGIWKDNKNIKDVNEHVRSLRKSRYWVVLIDTHVFDLLLVEKWDDMSLKKYAKAMFFVEQNYLSHSIQLADALIGASAIAYGLPIFTGNDKHYKAMADVKILKFIP